MKVLGFLLCLLSLQSTAQYSITHYDESDGLNTDLIKSIAFDKDGLVWIGSDDGLCRYDGVGFQHFNKGLPSKYIKSLLLSSKKKLYASTDMGLIRIHSLPDTVFFETIIRGSTTPNDSSLWYPKRLYEDKKGQLWVSDNNSLFIFDDTGIIEKFTFDVKNISNNFHWSFSFLEDKYDNLYTFSEPGYLFFYNNKNHHFEEIDIRNHHFSGIRHALQTDNEMHYFSADQGLFTITFNSDGNINNIQPLDDKLNISCFAKGQEGRFFMGSWTRGLIEASYINGSFNYKSIPVPGLNSINFILEHDNDLWISSDKGIYHLQEYLFTSMQLFPDENYISDIKRDSQENIYTIINNKAFLIHKNTRTPKLLAIPKAISSEIFLQILPTDTGFWLSDNESSVFLISNSDIKHSIRLPGTNTGAFRLYSDNEANLWCCANNEANYLYCIDKHLKTHTYGLEKGISTPTNSIHQSAAGKIYAGGSHDTAYLFEYNKKTDSFVNISHPIAFEHNIPLSVTDFITKADTFFLATNFGLLKHTKTSTERILLNDMSTEAVKAIVSDRNGDIWISNSKGLVKLFGGNYYTINEKQGLPSKNVSYRCLLAGDSPALWVGTNSGLACLNKLEPAKKTASPLIKKLSVDGKILPHQKKIKIDNRSYLDLSFVCPEYPGEDISYQKMISDIDTNWTNLERSRHLFVPRLESGEYSIKIRARKTGNYNWSESTTINLNVNTIWYRSFWGVVTFIALGGLLIYLIILYNTWRLRKDKKLLEEAINNRTREIKQQKDQIELQNLHIKENLVQLEEKNQALKIAVKNAEEATRTKEQFLSTMSHEVRTPMNAVIGLVNLLLEEDPKPEQEENLKTLKFSADNLLSLINDILDFNKIEAGRIILENTRFNLRDFLNNIIAAHKPDAIEKNIKFNSNIDAKIPKFLNGDTVRLAQIFNNLINNALKFTEQGSVLLEAIILEKSASRIRILFKVKDTGIGIKQDKQKLIFDSFTQAEKYTTRKYGGTGLGLAITKKLIELMGGKISLESQPGKGSTFSFDLKFDINTDQENTNVNGLDTSNKAKLKGSKILVVEDNIINQRIALKFLNLWQAETQIANNGKEALEILENNDFDLILMDLQMPVMDGYTTTKEIRNSDNKKIRNIPIIALTASVMLDVKNKVEHSGMNSHVSKPFKPEILLEKILKFKTPNSANKN